MFELRVRTCVCVTHARHKLTSQLTARARHEQLPSDCVSTTVPLALTVRNEFVVAGKSFSVVSK